jgi:hypothetical protein
MTFAMIAPSNAFNRALVKENGLALSGPGPIKAQLDWTIPSP